MGVAGLSNAAAGRVTGDRYADSLIDGQARPLSQGKSPHSIHDLGSRDQRQELPQSFIGVDSNTKDYVNAQRLSDDESESEEPDLQLRLQYKIKLPSSIFTFGISQDG